MTFFGCQKSAGDIKSLVTWTINQSSRIYKK